MDTHVQERTEVGELIVAMAVSLRNTLQGKLFYMTLLSHGLPGLSVFVLGTAVVFSTAASAAEPGYPISGQPRQGTTAGCMTAGNWMIPGNGRIAVAEVIARAARNRVVLLGEMHDNMDHHRWQLQMLSALYAVRPDMVIGFEMFPRRVQQALDLWVEGRLTDAEFLIAADWNTVWSTDASYYMPLFHFARMNRIPMVALNIDKRLRKGHAASAEEAGNPGEREGISRPAPPGKAYLDYLLPVYRQHGHGGSKQAGDIGHDDPGFRRFVEGQQLWDRAMAQAIRSTLERPERPLVVGIMGAGHIRYGHGVPHQLKDLGVTEVFSLLPWYTDRSCDQMASGLADAVFGMTPVVAVQEVPHQKLGIRFELAKEGGARILQVEQGSLAEASGMKEGDIVLEIAGMTVRQTSDVVAAVKRQAPGTWLPLKVKKGAEIIDMIVRFPVAAS